MCRSTGRASLICSGMVALLVSVTAGALSAEQLRPDIVLADFEQTDYAGWTATGTAFGTGPARGTLPGQMEVTGFAGQGLVNSFLGGDDSVGTLTAPEFVIERHFISFLIGGGGRVGQTCLQLLIDGDVVLSQTGPNLQSGGTEQLLAAGWDVRPWAGKSAVLRVVDTAQGGWGHVNVDQIVLTDTPPVVDQTDVSRTFLVDGPTLLLPVQNAALSRTVSIYSPDKSLVARMTIQLPGSRAAVDWWAPVDVANYQGQLLTVNVDQLRSDSEALSLIHCGELPATTELLYAERWRPQFHFSSQRGWLNDPNGLVYYEGEYHLFYQHNPYGTGWGNMHWGHAISPDLLHWREQDIKLFPDAMGMMYSGSGLMDWNNTSGLGADGKPPMILYYTASGAADGQCLAYSLDRGRTVKKWEGNPALPKVTPGNRDPKVFWHAPTSGWVMVLYVGLPGQGNQRPDGSREDLHTAQIFRSSDLKNWTKSDEIPGIFECPDLFPLPLDGQVKEQRWVLMGASSEYFVGEFDGYRFKPLQEKVPGHRGRNFYAAQTYSDIPAADGRRILVGWMQALSPDMPFNQCMSIPLELGLVTTPSGPRLTYQPVRELKTLEEKSPALDSDLARVTLKSQGDSDSNVVFNSGQYGRADLILKVSPNFSGQLNLRGIVIRPEPAAKRLLVADHPVPWEHPEEELSVTVLLDRTTLELFTADGKTFVPLPILLDPENHLFSITVSNGEIELPKARFVKLSSVWPVATE